MKNISIGIIILILGICYVLVLYKLAFDLNELIQQGDLSLSFVIKYRKEDLLIILLILLSATGIVVKEVKGWILTTQFFYSLMGAMITVLVELDQVMPSINTLTYSLAVIALIIPIVIMNTQYLRTFFKIDKSANMWINNALAISIAVLVGLLMWT